MAEQADQTEQFKAEDVIWPERQRNEKPEDYWTKVLAVNLRAPGANWRVIAPAFGRLIGQKEKREGQDGLTKLKTGPLFLKDLEEMVDHVYRQRESGKPENLHLVLIDIDNLRKLNNDLGHRKTDFVIQEIADIISSNRRKEDVVARIGGDEFAILLPDCDAKNAAEISEHLRRNIARQSRTTVSMGVAGLGRHDSPEELLEKTQVARELAKGNHVGEYLMPGKGKNRVVTWWEGMPLQVEQK